MIQDSMTRFLECLNINDTKTVAQILEICGINTPFDLPRFLAMDFSDWSRAGLIQCQLGSETYMRQYKKMLEMQTVFQNALTKRNGSRILEMLCSSLREPVLCEKNLHERQRYLASQEAVMLNRRLELNEQEYAMRERESFLDEYVAEHYKQKAELDKRKESGNTRQARNRT